MAQALDARRVAHGRCLNGDVAEDFVAVGVEAANAETEGAAGKIVIELCARSIAVAPRFAI